MTSPRGFHICCIYTIGVKKHGAFPRCAARPLESAPIGDPIGDPRGDPIGEESNFISCTPKARDIGVGSPAQGCVECPMNTNVFGSPRPTAWIGNKGLDFSALFAVFEALIIAACVTAAKSDLELALLLLATPAAAAAFQSALISSCLESSMGAAIVSPRVFSMPLATVEVCICTTS